MQNIKIITGSNRPTRFNIQPAKWILNLAQQHKELKPELLDLKQIKLPFLDEPHSPAQKKYTKDYTKKWSKSIDDADAFILITPEYNHSTSAILKNALDYLYYEWNYKPVTFVSYGSAGGSRAVEHLRTIAAEFKMYDLREQILMHNYWNNLDEDGNYQFSDKENSQAQQMLDSLAFWAKHMKKARVILDSKS